MEAMSAVLTERIIGCAIEVHRQLGPGLLESTYQTAMGLELAFNQIQFECERQIPVEYRGVKIGIYRPDLIVQNEVVRLTLLGFFAPPFLITGWVVALFTLVMSPQARKSIPLWLALALGGSGITIYDSVIGHF